MQRNDEIETLRAVAVTMVLLEHVNDNLVFWHSNPAISLQQSGVWTGVDLFFAISGFVIARSLLPKLQTARDSGTFVRLAVEFWIRRAWRIWPSSWLWLAAPLLLCLWFNSSRAYGGFQANWEMAVVGVLNVANFRFAEMGNIYPMGTAFVQWSLSLEEQFYLLLPVAAFLLGRWLWAPLLLIFAYAFVPPDSLIINPNRCGSIAGGVLLAIWSRHPTYLICAPVIFGRSRAARAGVLAGGLALLVSLGSSSLHLVSFARGLIAAVTVFLVWVASYGLGYLWRPGWPRRINAIVAARSYILYLVHIPVYLAVHEVWYRLHGSVAPTRPQAILYIAAALPVLAVVTELNHRLLETPLRERGRRVARQFATRSAASVNPG